MQETYNLDKKNWAAKLMAIVVVVTMVTSTFVLFAPEASARTDTDDFGYTMKDSAETDGPTYSWQDITLTGTKLLGGTSDGAQGPFDIGFDFEFYETVYTQFYNGGDNGHISFGGGSANRWTPYAIPTTQLMPNSIIGGWFDGGFCLTQNSDSGVYYQTIGDAGSRKLIIQMEDQVYYGARQGSFDCSYGRAAATNTITWQIILNEGSNTVVLQYKDAVGGSFYDNEYLTSGIQGFTGGTQYGIQYKYRSTPSTIIPSETAVEFAPPPPKRNDLVLSSTSIPQPMSLAEDNVLSATVTNNGVNCDTPGSCEAVPETNIDVTASIFSVKETESAYAFDDRENAEGWTHASVNGGTSKWTQALNDGTGNYNYGDEGTTDGSWSSGRKSTTSGGLFNDPQKLYYDGTDILVANHGGDNVMKIDGSTQAVSELIAPVGTNMRNILDVTSDEDYYYTLSRGSSMYAAETRVCKWDKTDLSSPVTCNASTARYGTAISIYGDELFVLQSFFSASQRKVVGLSTSDLSSNGMSLSYGSGLSGSYYSMDMDVDENTGDIYIVYRYSSGLFRAYDRDSSGNYCAGSGCYTQVTTGARTGMSIEVHNNYVYVAGYATSSYYGGMKRMATDSLNSVQTLWSYFGGSSWRGTIAVTDGGDIYVGSNYAYSYYSFRNNNDAVYYYPSGSYSPMATKTIGPAPAYMAALVSPSMDLSEAVGFSVSFKLSHNFYSTWEGAYMEISTDGGSTWTYVSNDMLTGNKYYGNTRAIYGNPLDTSVAAWTYYDTTHRYSSYSNVESWKETTATLDDFTGSSDVKLRWVVGFNTYLLSYYNSFFRVDDVTVSILETDTTFGTDTKTIDSISYKESESVSFFDEDGSKFRPATRGLSVGDKVGVSINVPGNENDQDKSNQRVVVFREVKYIIFKDDFEGDDQGWTTGEVQRGTSAWTVRSRDSVSGSNSMDSGYRNSNPTPADTYISTPLLDLGLPVEAEIQMKIAYYGYSTYEGYQAQISEDGGATWSMIEPVGGYSYRVSTSSYYNNPLRGQEAYTYYGSSTGFSWNPDPQGWLDAKFNLNDYTGQDDVKFRFVAGWSTLSKWAGYYNSFFRFDDFAVTGLVYNDNVGVSAIELPDPIGIDDTVALSTTVINAGINDQIANDPKLRIQVGPMGLQSYDTSDDLEDYTTRSDAESAGYTFTDKTCNTDYSTCTGWGNPAGFTVVSDRNAVALGPAAGEFRTYTGAGTTDVVTPTLDFTGAENDLKLTLTHRYNFDYAGGMTSAYNGGQVLVSTDDGANWELLTPEGGYPGKISGPSYYANPLNDQQAFIHCGDCTGVSKTASDNEDKYIETVFDMSSYVDQTQVKLKFQVGMYRYQYSGDGEHWYIGGLSFTGTGMESVAFEEIVSVSGATGPFVSGERFDYSKDFHFQVPGEYKIEFTTWIGDNPSAGDDFAGDNVVSAVRETMFTVASSTADAAATSTKNDELNQRYYEDGWTSAKDEGPEEGHQWRTDSTGSSQDSPVWSIGPDVRGRANVGDDVSLMSPVFDLSQATSAKLVFDHAFSFYQTTSSSPRNYDGGRVEISTNGGDTWSALPVTSGEPYGGTIYFWSYYGNPLGGQQGFVGQGGSSSGLVETQCSLNDYTGEGFDNLRLRFRFGGVFPDFGSTWIIDNIGIYGLGFDLKQTSSSTPYSLEVGESSDFTTSFVNQGKGDLGTGGAMDEAFAYAYINDMSGNEIWSESSSLGDLRMAYYDDNGDSFPGESTPLCPGEGCITFNYDGKDNNGDVIPAGMYTSGIMVADSNGNQLADLFSANNDASHMLLIGLSAEMGSPMLAGGSNWNTVSDAPAHVGSGALGVDWDETGVATGTLNIDIIDQASGFAPESAVIQIGTKVKWTNSDTLMTHTVTDKESQFDSFDISPGASYELTFNEVGVFNYYCKYHLGMEGTITVISDNSADEQARTNYVNVWSSDSYLYFWANYDMSSDSTISVYAQKKGSDINDAGTVALWGANGFKIMDGSDHTEVGDSLTGESGWNPYYIHLDSNKLGYNTLQYNPEEDNSYAFVFRARGVEGSAEIGNVQVIRSEHTGFFFAKDNPNKLTYEIFPSLFVEMDYFAKNIGTEDNEFQFTPELVAQGKEYMGEAFTMSVQVSVNEVESNDLTSVSDGNGTYTYAIELAPDDEAKITVRFLAPEFDAEKGEPAGNRKFDVKMNPVDTGSEEEMREPVSATLFIKPSQFVLGDMSYDRQGVLEGDSLAITVNAWNEGNYAADVLMVVYVLDSTGDAYNTPDGIKRMTRVASAIEPVMAPKSVLESQGIYQTWYPITAVWEEAFIPGETTQDFTTVELYAMINPDPEQVDVDNGHKKQDEYLNQKDDNDAFGQIAVVKDKSSTPSFALGIVGMSVAGLVAAAGASLRREEE